MSIFSQGTAHRIVLCLLAASIPALSAAEEYRTWKDASGKHSIRAKFDSVKEGKAILIREHGGKMQIALDKLSQEDQDFIAELTADNPFESVDETEQEGASDHKQEGGLRILKPDWSQSQAVLPPPSFEMEWKVELPAIPAAEYRPKSVPLRPKTDFFEHISGMAVSRIAKAAVVGYTLERHGDAKGSVNRVVLCDLEKGRIAASGEMTGDNMTPIALHDDGRQILMRRNQFGQSNQDRLEIWRIDGKNIVRTLQWNPYEDIQRGGHDVLWAEFLDADKLATCSRSGRIAIWNLSTGQPLCHLETADGASPALSPDRKWIAFAGDESMGLFDVAKQEVIAVQKTPRRLQWPAVAFSPSCRKIGCVAFDRILVWDTATGNLEKNFTTPGVILHGAVDFPDDDFILANHQYLIELQNQLKLWHYRGAEQVCTVGGTSFLAICGDDKGGLLLATKLPHPAATDLLKKALEQPDLFIFHKGTPIKLDVSGIPDAARRDSVKESLTKKFGEWNCPVQENANVEVVATIEGPKAKKISFMHSGTYDVQEYAAKLKFVHQKQTLWESSWTNIPHIVHLSADENMESYLRKASASPPYEFYDKVVLPEFLQKPSTNPNQRGSQTLGESNLTVHGL